MTIKASCYHALHFGIKAYQAMFDLTASELEQSILDCQPGASMFTYEMQQQGQRVIATDPLYGLQKHQINDWLQQANSALQHQTLKQPDRFEQTADATKQAYQFSQYQAPQFISQLFADDMQPYYKKAAINNLQGFNTQEFDLALSHHLLFEQQDHESLDFHLQSIQAMLRVANEIRLFPLTTCSGELSPFVGEIIATLQAQGFGTELRSVSLQFHKKGHAMLRIWHHACDIS